MTAVAGRILSVNCEPLAHRQALLRGHVIEIRLHLRRRRFRWNTNDVAHDVFAAQNGRRAIGIGRGQQHCALAEQSPARRIFELDSAELIALDAVDTVTPSQSLVDERVLRAQQVEHAPILAEDTVDEQSDLPQELWPRIESARSLR